MVMQLEQLLKLNPGQLVVALDENIKARLTWKNWTLAEGAEVTTVSMLAYFDAATGMYVGITFSEAGVDYYAAVSADDTAPASGVEKTTEMPTRAYVTVSGYPVLSALAAVGPRTAFTTLKKDARIVGIEKGELDSWWLNIYAGGTFTDVLQIMPTRAELTALEYVKG